MSFDNTSDKRIIPREEIYIRDFEDAERGIDILEESQSWGYADRDLACRILRFLLQKTKS
jgi:hypothetical protein